MRDLLAAAASMLLFPGLLAAAVVGVLAELAASRALRAGGAGGSLAGRGRPAAPGATTVVVGEGGLLGLAALLAMVAAAQIAAPFNPVAPGQRNVAVAALGLLGASWLSWWSGAAHPAQGARLRFGVQACWLLAVLAPVVFTQNLRPQVLGTMAVAPLQPLKAACALLYLLCLPVLLQLLQEPADRRASGARARSTSLRPLLWLPVCGLFASLYTAPASEDLAGMARFLGLTLAAAAGGIALSAALRRMALPAAQSLHLKLVLAGTGLTLVLFAAGALLLR